MIWSLKPVNCLLLAFVIFFLTIFSGGCQVVVFFSKCCKFSTPFFNQLIFPYLALFHSIVRKAVLLLQFLTYFPILDCFIFLFLFYFHPFLNLGQFFFTNSNVFPTRFTWSSKGELSLGPPPRYLNVSLAAFGYTGCNRKWVSAQALERGRTPKVTTPTEPGESPASATFLAANVSPQRQKSASPVHQPYHVAVECSQHFTFPLEHEPEVLTVYLSFF